MATLEVHDGRGRVERVRLTREEPLIFGGSAACTIVLDGEGVAPVHGRIRWQKRRFKLDAGADVDAIELNGKRVKSSSLYQGDEIRVGPCRIFVISTEDAGSAAPEDDRTRIQPAPKALDTAPASGAKRSAVAFESPSFAEVLSPPTQPEPLRRQRPWKQSTRAQAEPLSPASAPAAPSPWSKLRSMLARPGEAPGEERILSSPVVLGLAVTLATLVGLSVVLFRVIVKSNAEKQYTKAFESLDDGDYRNAIKQLDQFLTAYPEDKRAGKAKVFRALARVRQFTASSGASWDNALQAAQAMVSEVRRLPEYRDASTELAEQLVKTVEGLADRARSGADRDSLREAEAALALHANVAGKAAESLIGRSRAPAKLTQARDAIRRAETKTRALAAIDGALTAGSASKAYALRDDLVAVYPDLSADRDVIARLLKANDLIRKAARFDPSARPGETEPHPDPLGPATTLVLRLEPGRKPSGGGSVVHALADGAAFGLEAATGTPLWQVPVGLSSPFPPMAIVGGEPAVLLVDARFDELVRLDGRTGKLTWRQELGERVVDPPLIVGNQVFQTTPSGKLLEIDLANGALRGTLDLGRPLTRSPVTDESGAHLFLLGDEDVLFVLDRDPLGCRSVEYLGHDPGSIACAPARVGRFLVVAENTTMTAGQWRVFVLDEDGATIKPRQSIPIAGWTWRTPPAAGSTIWSASDRGEVIAFSIGLYDADPPFKPVAAIAADNVASGPAFGMARSEREFWVAGGRSTRFDLNTESGKLTAAWTLGQVSPAVAPIQTAEKIVVFTQQSTDGPGVALSGVDARSGTVVWRTTLGAPWPLPLTANASTGSIETLGFDGRRLAMNPEQITSGGFVEQSLPKPGAFRVPSLGAAWLSCGESSVLIPNPSANHMLVRKGNEGFRAVDLPSALGARPIAWDGNVLVPGADGRIYLIDPNTGESAADPYVPRFDRAHPSRWRTPVAVSGDAVVLADDEGHLRRLTRATTPRPRLVVSGETSLGKPLASELGSTNGAVLAATVEGKVRAFAARDLSPVASIDLTGPRTLGPVVIDRLGFVGDASGDVFAFSGDGRKLWQGRLRSPAVDPPAVRDGAVWFLTRAGMLESRSLAQGSSGDRVALGVLPAGPLLLAGSRLIVPSGLGSIRPLLATRPGTVSSPDRSPTTEKQP